MTLYSYSVIYNPINDWVSSRNYFVGNQVLENSVFFTCTQDHTSDNTNKPPGTFWTNTTSSTISPNTDVTKFIETLKETEIGSGEVRNLSLRFNANRGAFITKTNTNLTPIIDQFDKFKITIKDRFNKSYTAYYEVDIVYPTQDGSQGTVLPVDLLGSEFYLQKTLFTDQFFFKSMFDTSKGIIDFYNTNKGTSQVRVVGADKNSANSGFNDLPAWTANDFTFNLNEKTHYDGLIDVLDRGGSSVAAGGAGDFFELAFENNATNQDEIKFRAFSSGNPSDQDSIPNIKSTSVALNPAEQEGEIDSTVGNVTGTWCAESIGTLPRQNADFIGGLEAWQLFPEYVASETYPKDAIILVVNTLDAQGDNFHYKTNTETTIVPPIPPTASNADWDQILFSNFLTNEVSVSQYSIWTKNKQDEWKSNGANTNGTQNEDPPTSASPAIWDSNQVKIDGKFRQTWADVRALSPNLIPSQFIRNQGVYRGFRVLVDGNGAGLFEDFSNDVVQWNGTQWLIFLIPKDQTLCGIDSEALTYQFQKATPAQLPAWNPITIYGFGSRVQNNSIAFQCIVSSSFNSEPPSTDWLTLPAWQNISTSLNQSNDVYHPVWAIFNTQGQNNKNDGGTGNFGALSAVTFEFRMSKSDSLSGFNTPTFYRQFVGANFRVPFPFNSFHNNTIGELYGNSDSRLPATFEAENMGLTSSGLSGFNNIEAEDLGPFDAITFFIKHEWRYNKDGSGGLVFAGNFAYRCALYDIDDTVVIQDFVIPFNLLWEPVSLPIASFKTYKARAAWAFGNAAQNIFLQELEILNSFRWRNIKKIAIHWLGPYDDQGRYNPNGQIEFLFPSILDLFSGLFVDGYNVKLSIDSFQWAKPGLSISPPNTTRPLQPVFFYEPFITNKFQNDQANLAKLEITKFRHKEFEITTVGSNDLKYGDSFFLENSKLVKESDRTLQDLPSWNTGTKYIINDDVKNANQTLTGYRCIKNNTASATNEPPNTEFWSILPEPIPNTIKLVVKKIIRLIDKVPTGAGGFLRTITGVRRFKETEL